MIRRFKLPKLLTLSLLVTVYFLVSGCAGTVVDNDSPAEVQYAEGERLLKKDRTLEAVERFRILKNRYPYSKYAALATLKIGDAHYQAEAYIEAASAYKIFRDLYPKHEHSAYALYRIGECHYNLMPSTSDRDLEPATSAINAYEELIEDFPGSPDRPEAERKIGELRKVLAEKEEYVGNFYFIREFYQAAAGRYQSLLQSFQDNPFKETALYRLAFSQERIGEFQKAKDTLAQLLRDFPKPNFDVASLQKRIEAGLEAAAK